MAAPGSFLSRCWTNVTILAIFVHLLIFVSLPKHSTSTVTEPALDRTGNPTILPPTKVSHHTVGPLPSHTPAHTIATAPPYPTAGLLCGEYTTDDYDLIPLIRAEYWTIDNEGSCLDSYHSKYICHFKIAFCRQLPKDLVLKDTGIGVAQQSAKPGSKLALLGHLSRFEQTKDEKGHQLVARFPSTGFKHQCSGKDKDVQVEVHLHCNEDVVWPAPVGDQPAKIPTKDLLVIFDEDTCIYTIEVDYNGACPLPTGLSPGTIIIIIFFSLVAVYLVVGMIYNKSTGAKGLEVIPNYDMWRMFPGDVLGGVVFVVRIITCQGMGSKQQVYDEL